jgi:hypothetical protein
VSPRAARTYLNPKTYFRLQSPNVLGFGNHGSRGRDPSTPRPFDGVRHNR